MSNPDPIYVRMTRKMALDLMAIPVPHRNGLPLPLMPPRPTILVFTGHDPHYASNACDWFYWNVDPDARRMA